MDYGSHGHKTFLPRAKVIGSVFLSLLVLAVPAAWADIDPATTQPVATVNGETITGDELAREIARLQRKHGKPAGRDVERDQRSEALNNLVKRELLWQESRRQGITVPAGDVARQLEGLKKNQSSAIELGKTLDEMDLSEEIVRSETERGIAVRQLIGRRLGGRMEPSEKEIKEYYDRHAEIFRVPEQVRINHILVRIEPRWQADKKEAARQRVKDIRERLRKGEDFVALAKESSECPSGMNGGNLGWFSRGSLTGQMETAVYSLHEGSVSNIVEDRFGFHVIKVTGRRQARTVSFTEGRGKIVEYLRQEKIRSEGEALARDLRGRAKVEVFVAEGD